ncbi:MAG TPA: polysaccharide pyruvyl transferase family protein [Candidatus Ozemobacteraceae bacterium]|nr:polysaccharide pyruvyl transferase family protein [Candidatus Ozemobacteraceae bacterium]
MKGGHLLLTGFYGEGNLGDDAILRGIASSLPAGTRILATAGNTPLPPGIHGIRRRGILSWPAFLGALKGARLVVGSGGLLQDWSLDGVTFYALRFLAARLAGKPVALFGAGLGPLRSTGTRSLAAFSLGATSHCHLRDDESVRLFHELTGREAQRGADWSWGISASSRGSPTPRNLPSDVIAINIRPWLTHDWREAATRWLAGADRKTLIGISARPEDRRLMERVWPGLRIHEPADFSALLADASVLREGWAMRYHVLLALLRAGVPVRALPYDGKARHLAEAAGLPVPEPGDSAPSRAERAARAFLIAEEERFARMSEAFRQAWEEAA